MLGQEVPVPESVPVQHMDEGKSEGRITAREGLQVQVRLGGGVVAHRVDHDHLGPVLLQPMLVGVGRRGRGVGTPDDHALAVGDGLGVETDHRGPEDI